MRTDNKKRLYAYIYAVIVIAADQITKLLTRMNLEIHRPVEIIGDYLRFTFAWNEGAAFSLSWGGPWVLGIFTGIAVIVLTVYIRRCGNYNQMTFIAFGLVLGGALGNLIDRCIFGKVVDFIDIGVTGRRWPTFNVADIAISIGGILLLVTFMRDRGKETGNAPE